ncbi:ribonuclease R [Hornefia butyriciproducens]|uniref:ribonuclease R n=1 Tax=Hornefia butyriciproducens TaxID=2652293 RepID=UPI0023F31E48|nr:ribonuclease R [Hornefia butyriciproducens]MDD6299490.1 ribonuclease R [Hornefia butyriciproducens]
MVPFSYLHSVHNTKETSLKMKMKKKKSGTRTGILEKTRNGSGFVRSEYGDIYIDRSNIGGAMHGDRVRVDLLPPQFWGRNPEGIVDKILERGSREIVGTYHRGKRSDMVIPDDRRNSDNILVRRSASKSARDGDRVVCVITRYPGRKSLAEGRLTEIIARRGEVGGEIRAMIRAAGLRVRFPARCETEAAMKAKQIITPEDIAGRRDLREKTIITIDGADSKDLDDAVSIDRLYNGNYLLGVHIADVSHYVSAGSPLDREAMCRGNSVYLLTQVIPMLPKSLSNGICSLFEGVDRLTLSCEMEIDRNGNIVNHDIYESVINNKARMVYDDVSDILEHRDEALIQRYQNICDSLLLMEELAEILREKRKRSGSIDFDFDEADITLGEREIPVDISIAPRRTANRMIEEFMLAANKTIAEHFYQFETPFVYRVHEKPDPAKIMELRQFLAGFGIDLRGNADNVHPAELNRILDLVHGKPEENIVSTVLLRSMTKAYYSTECAGHFGLAFHYYCHFTSPIRRYPDLIDHRIIKSFLRGSVPAGVLKKYRRSAEQAAEIASQTERQAQELERDVEKMKKAQYMKDHIGEIHDGIISGVTGFGIYVQLPNTVEGMIRLSDLNDDYYIFEAEKYRLIGERTRRVFALGDRITIEVLNANPDERQIDFGLAERDS